MSAANLLDNLNEPQLEAAAHVDGPLLIFAGAGSGKTRVLTYRIANLVANHEIDPQNILAVTFTKKAAQEMIERVNNIFEEKGLTYPTRPQIGTFHSLSALIIRKEGARIGFSPNFSIYDSDDSEGMVKQLMMANSIDVKQFKPKAIYHMIGSAKNDMISPIEYGNTHSGYVEDIVAQIYPEYQKQLKAMNAMDFGDLLYYTAKLVNEDEEILKKYQDLYRYIMVDEYQDTNKVQYMLVRALSKDHQNLCVVGDDDQSIYKWRGADIQNIISFEKHYKDVKIVKLEQNYRSVGNIIDAAVAVITQNNQRIDKKLWTDKEEGEKITVYQARDEKGEAQFLADEILNLKNNHYTQLGDIAILYRTNFQSRVIEEAMLKRGIPYKLVGGFRFYDRKEVKDILSYLRLINNHRDDVSLFRVINTPSRKMGPKSVADLVKTARDVNVTTAQMLMIAYILSRPDLDALDLGFTQEEVNSVDGVFDTLGRFQKVINVFGRLFVASKENDVEGLIKEILSVTGYVDFIDDGSDAAESRKQNIQELRNVAATYAKKYKEKSLNKFLMDIALIEEEQEKSKKESSKGAITMMTLHASKGLEFPCIFMVGMEEGVLPHSRSFTEPAELEEERRLTYVGITRAQKRLWLSFSEVRTQMGGTTDQIPSRFLGEIPQELCEYYSWNL